MNITIIGAGPVGCYTAELLAKKGHEVTVYEEHTDIGRPVQCTGLVTSEIEKIVDLGRSVIHKFSSVRVNDSLKVQNDDILIDRATFDKEIAIRAQDAGAEIKRGRLISINQKLKFDGFNEKIPDALIGADGPRSIVSSHLGNSLKHWIGAQARVVADEEASTYDVWLGSKAPEFFAWSVPENGTVSRVGLAGVSNVNTLFKSLIAGREVKEMQGGLIPRFNPSLKVSNRSTYVVGDAAGMVKATTGGGLVPGLKGAACLAQAIETGEDYMSLLKKEVWPNLKKHLLIRRMLDKIKPAGYTALVKALDKESVRKILYEHNRDQDPLTLVMKVLIRAPGVVGAVVGSSLSRKR